MNKIILLAAILLTVSCYERKAGNSVVLLKQIDSLKIELSKTYNPGFGELMSGIQNHHTKLWFAGLSHNWALASFEIHEIKEIIDDIKIFQSDRKEVGFLSMISQSIDDIEGAINDKSVGGFKKKYIRMTNSCNECHAETNFNFIKIVVPDKNPFTDQEY